jgi:hypothetical protein
MVSAMLSRQLLNLLRPSSRCGESEGLPEMGASPRPNKAMIAC